MKLWETQNVIGDVKTDWWKVAILLCIGGIVVILIKSLV